MLAKLYRFQVQGIEFAVSRHGRALIGDEMGTGKTVQALAVAYIYRSEWPLLILVPASLRFVWRDEVRKWLPTIPAAQVEVIKRASQSLKGDKQIYIVSYSIAKDLQQTLRWKVVIADEAHYLKNKQAKRTIKLSPIIMGARRAILLSGTPMLGRPSDIYNSMHVLRPDVFKTFREFGHRYCDPKKGWHGIEWKGATNTEELHWILMRTAVIRRKKAEVLKELPTRLRQKIEVEANEKHVRKIRQILGRFSAEEISSALMKEDGGKELKDRIMEAYQLTGLAKIRGIIEFLDTLVENDTKFILFAEHLAVLDSVAEELRRRELDYVRIDGAVPMEKRHELVAKFQTEETCKVALLSISASSQGISLTAANTVVFAEYNWTPGMMDQAEGRVHRIGQESPVNVYYLHASDTLDNVLYGVVRSKERVVAEVIDGNKSGGESSEPAADDRTVGSEHDSSSQILEINALARIEARSVAKRRVSPIVTVRSESAKSQGQVEECRQTQSVHSSDGGKTAPVELTVISDSPDSERKRNKRVSSVLSKCEDVERLEREHCKVHVLDK